MFTIREVDGLEKADVLRHLNGLVPDRFPDLETHHLREGHWWLAYASSGDVAGFAGMVPMKPFDVAGIWYMKRAYVAPPYRGHGLQLDFMRLRLEKARQKGWIMLVGECEAENAHSARNFLRAGFRRCDPEQPWCRINSMYFVKTL